MGSAPADRRGIAAGTLATARTSGQLLGVAIASAVYFTQGMNSYFGFAAFVMLGVEVLSWLRE